MTLARSHNADNVRNLLGYMDKETLLSLARTASKNRILPVNHKEAIEVVLECTADLDCLFSYKRITVAFLLDYLHSCRAIRDATNLSTKMNLVTAVKQYWKEVTERKSKKMVEVDRSGGKLTRTASSPPSNTVAPTTSYVRSLSATTILPSSLPSLHVTQNCSINLTEIKFASAAANPATTTTRSDQFVQSFCEWYYNMVNSLQPQMANSIPADTFTTDVFFDNGSTDVYILINNIINTERHAQGSAGSVQLLKNTFQEFGLLFNPNLDTGTQVEQSSHGLVRVMCCGTLHKANSLVGIFEQEFGLGTAALTKAWKIMYTKLNLKQADIVPQMPSLPPSAVFEIKT